MKQLWAPWRIEFVTQPKASGCILCLKPREKRDTRNFILYRGRYWFVMMNIYPYNNGHLLISPYLHIGALEELPDRIFSDLQKVINYSVKAVKRALSSEGMNIGINLGKVAGAGIEDHLHFHLIPRWQGDTNFMPVLSEVRVIPEHLRATYNKLRTCFPRKTDSHGSRKKGGRP
jgi:ATP adenylyltransferase